MVAVLLLPLLVEPSLAERLAEGGPVGIRELKPLSLKLRLQGVAEVLDIRALKQRGIIDVAADDLLEIGGQALPSAPVAEKPVPVSHVIGERAVFLHLIELCCIDGDKRIFLPINDVGLQRRIDLCEIDARRRCTER